MMLKHALKDWLDFFSNKNGAKIDQNSFSEIELWEEDYLIKKIQSQYDYIPEEKIRSAVKSCYTIYHSPQSGEKLVQCVISKLSIEKL